MCLWDTLQPKRVIDFIILPLIFFFTTMDVAFAEDKSLSYRLPDLPLSLKVSPRGSTFLSLD